MAGFAAKAPPISVVMPVRDGEAYLKAAIDSILDQDFGDFEFIIVDDGSRDATSATLKASRERDARIRIFETGGAGIVAALNLGVSHASGTYIARMDADDIALPVRFAVQLEEMERSPELLALGSAATEIDESGRVAGAIAVASSPEEVRRQLRYQNPMLHPTVMMRRSAFLAAGGYRNALTYAEDYDLWLRLSVQGDIANLAAPLLKLRRHGGQTSGVRRLDQRAATAFARQMNADGPRIPATTVDMSVTLHAALHRYLAGRLVDSRPIAHGEAKDLAIMLRAAARDSPLAPSEIWTMCRRIAVEGGLQSAWMLPIKVWLRR